MKFSIPIPLSLQSSSVGDIYEAILHFLDSMEVGTDCLLLSDIQYNDELGFTTTYNSSFYQLPSDTAEAGFFLPVGLYGFEQLPFTPEKQEQIVPLFIRFIADEASRDTSQAYIRIYKEKRFETAVQFMILKESV